MWPPQELLNSVLVPQKGLSISNNVHSQTAWNPRVLGPEVNHTSGLLPAD